MSLKNIWVVVNDVGTGTDGVLGLPSGQPVHWHADYCALVQDMAALLPQAEFRRIEEDWERCPPPRDVDATHAFLVQRLTPPRADPIELLQGLQRRIDHLTRFKDR